VGFILRRQPPALPLNVPLKKWMMLVIESDPLLALLPLPPELASPVDEPSGPSCPVFCPDWVSCPVAVWEAGATVAASAVAVLKAILAATAAAKPTIRRTVRFMV